MSSEWWAKWQEQKARVSRGCEEAVLALKKSDALADWQSQPWEAPSHRASVSKDHSNVSSWRTIHRRELDRLQGTPNWQLTGSCGHNHLHPGVFTSSYWWKYVFCAVLTQTEPSIHLLSTYCGPGTVVSSGNIAVTKTDKNPCLPGGYILVRSKEE